MFNLGHSLKVLILLYRIEMLKLICGVLQLIIVLILLYRIEMSVISSQYFLPKRSNLTL